MRTARPVERHQAYTLFHEVVPVAICAICGKNLYPYWYTWPGVVRELPVCVLCWECEDDEIVDYLEAKEPLLL